MSLRYNFIYSRVSISGWIGGLHLGAALRLISRQRMFCWSERGFINSNRATRRGHRKGRLKISDSRYGLRT